MKYRSDGSVQSNATPTWQNVGRKEDYAMYRCMVTKVVYCDDPSNITRNSQNPRVLYDVVVLGGFATGQIISNCRLGSSLGGNTSYWERILRASEKAVSEARLAECDGDVVLVQFNQGHTAFPTIIAMDQGITTTGIIGAKLADGPLSVEEFNGVYSLINNAGEHIFKVKGGTASPEKGAFTPAKVPLTTFSITKDEKYSRVFKSGLSIVEDGANDVVKIVTKGGTTFTVDGKSDKTIIVNKGGVSITLDGKSDAALIKTKGGAELHLKEAKVALGAGSTEVLKQLSDALDKMITLAGAEAAHTHIGNLGYPTAPPSTAGDWGTLASELGTIKGKIDAITGSL